jgi:hypothetical protein
LNHVSTFPPIIAAGWSEIIVPLIVFIMYAIGQLLSAKKPGGQQPARPRLPRPQAGGGPPQQPGPVEEKLRGEVEEFLRQMQGNQPAAKPRPQRPGRQPKKSQPVVVRVEQVRPAAVEESFPERRESVQEHVAQHISTKEIATHVRTLGAEVGQADEKLQSHLQERFQHQLGSLVQQGPAEKEKIQRQSAAAEIAQLLRSPNGARQIIIASEILRRPEI